MTRRQLLLLAHLTVSAAAVVVFEPGMAVAQEAVAQEAGAGGIAELTLEQNQRRISINKTGMAVLLGWAGANMAVGTAGYFMADAPRWKYFHQMNAGWNVVNAAIGGFGLAGALSEDPASYGLAQTFAEGHSIQTILALNIGLDAAYMAGGAWMWERGVRKDSDRLVGYGRSLILQGGFLFAFDIALIWLHHRAMSDFTARVQPLVGEVTGATLSVAW